MHIKSITGHNGGVIKPRIEKSKKEQAERIRNKAEVFTPSWICNKQNNLIDNAWFGTDYVFNEEIDKTWIATTKPIVFPTETDKTWKDYINDVRLEITCGEAPYLVSRYDTVSGYQIELSQRIGLLDRKLRVVNENTQTENEWLKWAIKSFQNIYGYDWQGDNVLLARENLFFTFIEYYKAKFSKEPTIDILMKIAEILSWNIWQMDGLRGVIPNSCGERREVVADLFGTTEVVTQCEGCLKDDIRRHNGVYCQIKDWHATDKATGKKGKRIRFIDLIK